jgi:hypothetical protein
MLRLCYVFLIIWQEIKASRLALGGPALGQTFPFTHDWIIYFHLLDDGAEWPERQEKVHSRAREINLTTHFTANKFCVIVNLRSFRSYEKPFPPRYSHSFILRSLLASSCHFYCSLFPPFCTTLLFIESGRTAISHQMLPLAFMIDSVAPWKARGRSARVGNGHVAWRRGILVSLNSLHC